MNERKIAKFAIILVRVSSKEQEDGYSLEAQKYRLLEYCPIVPDSFRIDVLNKELNKGK